MSESSNELYAFIGATLFGSGVILITTKIIRGAQMRLLKPDLVELRKANEILDANNDKKQIMNDILKKYNQYDFNMLKNKYPIYVPAMMDLMNQFLQNDENIYSKENITNIKKLINYQGKDAYQSRIAGLFFISLIIDKDFDLKKYRAIVITNHKIKESKKLKQVEIDITIAGLKVIAKDELSKILTSNQINQ